MTMNEFKTQFPDNYQSTMGILSNHTERLKREYPLTYGDLAITQTENAVKLISENEDILTLVPQLANKQTGEYLLLPIPEVL